MNLSAFVSSPLGQWAVGLAAVGVLALFGRLAQLGSKYVHTLTLKAIDEHRSVAQVMFLRASDALAQCASDAVLHIESTLRPTILGAAKDGKLDAAQAQLLKNEAVKLALEQSRVVFGAAMSQIGANTDALVPTIEHLVNIAAERLAGHSRDVTEPQWHTKELVLEEPTTPPKPEMRVTDMQGQPIPQ